MMRIAASLLAMVALAAAAAADPGLTTGEWTIVEMGGKRLRAPATINFTRVRWLGANTACGALWGWYRQSGASLKIHIPGRARYAAGSGSPCHGIDFQLLLGRVRSFKADGDGLVFLNGQEKTVARLTRKK
jgi:hypothetical protein